MATETVENYLKAIHTLSRESAAGEAAMSRIAVLVGVTTGTATTMIKKLAAAKLANYERFGGVKLTAKGTAAALDILRRHRLVETFLVRTLKLDWAVVHAEAERLEHAISPAVLDALDAHLGRPTVDPHGDPIPDPRGKTRDPGGAPLSTLTPPAKVRVLRIANQDAAFLTLVARHGLTPGAAAALKSVDAAAQSLTVQAKGHAPLTLATSAAARIVCETV
ncbi:metal-dependent transcriptional regulator [soil metagenome]